MADSSFDIVSKIDRQEADNALNQAVKEISQRYDFKNTGAAIAWSGELGIEITANAEERALAVLDVFQNKLIKRGISLKSLDTGAHVDVRRGAMGTGRAKQRAARPQTPQTISLPATFADPCSI